MLGHYEIRDELGRGAHGVAYRAYDTRLERQVVIKRLLPGGDRAGIVAEARLAAEVDHPNVCAIHDIDELDGEPFIVMQYVDGRSLAELCAAGPMTIPLVLSIATQIASGLAAAHAHGIVHRDLKPSNVLVTESGLAKILDFGLARRRPPLDPGVATSAAASSSGRFGTVGYMAPEQFESGRSSPASDVFALGVLLYQMIGGRHPFEPAIRTRQLDHHDELARAIRFQAPQPLVELRPGTPAALGSVVERCLEKQPARRFDSAAEALEALRAVWRSLDPGDVLAGSSIAPTAPHRHGRRWLGWLDRLRGEGGAPLGSIAVLPFTGDEPALGAYFGLTLAEAIAGRLARLPWLEVRAATAALSLDATADVAELGRRLGVAHVLVGSFAAADDATVISWQLVDRDGRLRAGDSVSLSGDVVALQTQVAGEIFRELSTARLGERPPADDRATEALLEARALIDAFRRRSRAVGDLEKAEALLEQTLRGHPRSALAHEAAAEVHLSRVRNGFDGAGRLAAAHASIERALAIDPEVPGGRLTQMFVLLGLGDKASARRILVDLLAGRAGDGEVNIAAAIMLRLDGCHDHSLERLRAALVLSPDRAATIYAQRARVYGYRDQREAAAAAIAKGMAVAPDYPPLRIALGYQQMREGDHRAAVRTLEAVVADEPRLHVAYPALAMARLAAGDADAARALFGDHVERVAAADGETAYRVATFHALDSGREGADADALAWLRRAIDLGNENLPWFRVNPAWAALRGDPRLEAIFDELAPRQAAAARAWSTLLE